MHVSIQFYSRYESSESKYSDLLSYRNVISTEKKFCNSDSNAISSDLDQETTNATCSDKGSVINLPHLNNADTISSVVSVKDNSVIPIEVCTIFNIESFNNHPTITNLDQKENSNNLKDKTAKAYDIAKGNLNHQRCISQDEKGTENNNILKLKRFSTKRKIKHNTSSTNLSVINVIRCKVLLFFGVCFIIGCCLMPIVLYYAVQFRGNFETDPDYFHEKNISSAKVCCVI